MILRNVSRWFFVTWAGIHLCTIARVDKILSTLDVSHLSWTVQRCTCISAHVTKPEYHLPPSCRLIVVEMPYCVGPRYTINHSTKTPEFLTIDFQKTSAEKPTGVGGWLDPRSKYPGVWMDPPGMNGHPYFTANILSVRVSYTWFAALQLCCTRARMEGYEEVYRFYVRTTFISAVYRRTRSVIFVGSVSHVWNTCSWHRLIEYSQWNRGVQALVAQ